MKEKASIIKEKDLFKKIKRCRKQKTYENLIKKSDKNKIKAILLAAKLILKGKVPLKRKTASKIKKLEELKKANRFFSVFPTTSTEQRKKFVIKNRQLIKLLLSSYS